MKKLLSTLVIFLVSMLAVQTMSAQQHNPKYNYQLEKTISGVRIAIGRHESRPNHTDGILYNHNNYPVVVEYQIMGRSFKADGTPKPNKTLIRKGTINLSANGEKGNYWMIMNNLDDKYTDLELTKFVVTRK